MIPDIFKKDWFDGRTIDAISADDTKRIGWENELTNYSEFLFDENYLKRLLNDQDLILSELNKIVDAMNVEATINFMNNVETAYTDGRSVVIGKQYVPNSRMTNTDNIYNKFDILIGLLIHELCHCKYTDFEYCSKNRNLLNKIIHSIHNILEDECIERNIGLSLPGYSNYIKSVKRELFKKQMGKRPIIWGVDEMTDIFNILLIVVRYPETLSKVPEYILGTYSDLFKKIYDILKFKGILDRKENFNCTRDTVSAAIAIFNLLNINESDLRVSIDNSNSNSSSKSGNGNNQDQSSDKDISSNNDSSGNNNQDSEQSDGQNASENNQKNQGSNKFNNESNSNSSSNSNESEPGSGVTQYDPSDERTSMGDALNSLNNSSLEINELNIDSLSEIDNDDTLQRIYRDLQGTAYGTNNGAKFDPTSGKFTGKISEPNKSNALKYNRIYGRISKYVKSFKKIIIPKGTNEEYKKINFQRSGQLDPNQLINALTGGRFVNSRMQKHIVDNCPKYAIVINIDEGSSMRSSCLHNCEHKHKITSHNEMANELTILICEALADYPQIQLYVYGSGTEVHKYISPKNKQSKYTITGRKTQGLKDYLKSSEAIIDDVRKQTNLPIVLINISDGFYKVQSDFEIFKNKLKKLNVMSIMINVCTFNNLRAGSGKINSDIVKFNDNLYGEDGWIQNDMEDTFEDLATKLANSIKSKYKKH